MSRTKSSEKLGNGSKSEPSVWTRAITANSEWPDKVNITSTLLALSPTSWGCIPVRVYVFDDFLFCRGLLL